MSAGLGTSTPAWAWSAATRGSDTPACAYACCIRDEQSQRPMTEPNGSLQVPPHWYQEPIWATAHDIAVSMIALPVSSTWPGSGAGMGPTPPPTSPGLTDHCEARSMMRCT